MVFCFQIKWLKTLIHFLILLFFFLSYCHAGFAIALPCVCSLPMFILVDYFLSNPDHCYMHQCVNLAKIICKPL